MVLLIQNRDKRRDIISTLVLVVVLALVGYVLYRQFLADQVNVLTKSKNINAPSALPSLPRTFETDFLGREPYRSLRRSAELPIRTGTVGRPNPFTDINYEGSAAPSP